MNKTISSALLAAGIILMVYGTNASNSLSSDISRFFTGSPTDKTVWLITGGLIMAMVGFFGVFRRSES